MEDMERYGDYDEIDEEPRKRGGIGIFLKVLVAVVCIAVIGVMVFRIVIFNSYPAEVSRLIFSDTLAEYYGATGGDIGAMTQSTRLSYDDPKEGNFFFGELIVVPGAEHLQVTVRYNVSLMESIKTKYGVTLDPDADPFELFDFKLARTPLGYVSPEGESEPPIEYVGALTARASAESMMYRYARLGFDGVEFGLGEGETPVGWYRLEISIKGVDMKPYTLPVYQYGLGLEDYELGKDEVPQP